MTNCTEVVNDDHNATIAYLRPKKLTWRQQGEMYITRIRDWYDTWLPRIGSALLLLWLINTFHK